MAPWLLALIGCGGGDLSVTPASLSWGEVDFQQERPPQGYAPQELVLRNEGTRDLIVRIEAFDTEHLYLGAALATGDPPELPPLAPGSSSVVTVGVWDYAPGEWDTLVAGAFRLDADTLRDPVVVDWSFTPVRVIGADTGP